MAGSKGPRTGGGCGGFFSENVQTCTDIAKFKER